MTQRKIVPRTEPVPEYPFHPRNRYKVPPAQWAKWPDVSRAVFNGMYQQLMLPRHVQHPRMLAMPYAHWKTIQWNAAWLAADNVRDCLRAWADAKT